MTRPLPIPLHRLAPLAAACLLAACATSPRANAPALTPTPGCCAATELRIAERYRVGAIATRRFTAETFWRAVAPSLASPAFKTEEIGRSILGRPIRTVTFGEGKTTVLLWSQMHGDESTGTMALADIFRYLADTTSDPMRERLRHQLTLVFVPMLNPDGAELFQRRDAAGIDINRDAHRLATPEGRALKVLRDRTGAQFGFNLHDQDARQLVGSAGKQAAIALEAPAFSADRSYNDVRTRARLLAATIAQILSREIPGRIAKYDDAFMVRAFGDNMQKWGTSTVLVESGALPNDPEKQRLRALNVVAILGALDAIATGQYAATGPQIYDRLPYNNPDVYDLLVRGGELVLPGQAPIRADLAIDYDEAVAHRDPRVRDIGDLEDAVSIDTVDATGLYLHPERDALTVERGGVWLRVGAPAHIAIRRGADPSSALVTMIGGSVAP